MMAKIHGKNTHFAVGNVSTDALEDFSDFLNSIERSIERDLAESTGFKAAGGFKTYVAGLKDGSLSVSGQYEGGASGADAVLNALMDTDIARSWEYGPEGDASGTTRYSGGPNGGGAAGEGVLMSSYNLSSPLEDVVTFDAEFQITGAQIRGTFA